MNEKYLGKIVDIYSPGKEKLIDTIVVNQVISNECLFGISEVNHIETAYYVNDEIVVEIVSSQEENDLIVDAINLLNNGTFEEKKPYLTEIIKTGATTINNFLIQKDKLYWTIWKDTNLFADCDIQDAFLAKIVPRSTKDANKINAVLNSQKWTYV